MIAAKPDVAKPRDALRVLSLGAEWLTVRAGGLNRYTAGLAQGLEHHKVDQRWLVMGDSSRSPRRTGGVRFVASPQRGMWHRWRGMRAAFASELAWQPDVVASHFAPYSFPLCRQLKSCPHVVHFHGPWAEESATEGAGLFNCRLKRLVERSIYRTGDRFIVLSQAFADVLVERYRVNPDLVRVIPGGVDIERFASDMSRSEAREALGWDQERPLILSMRRLVHRTGVVELIRAMEDVRARNPDALLLVAGMGPLESRLRGIIDSRGLDHHVRLLGFVPEKLLPLAYRAADVSVMPSQTLEGFGLSAAESLAAGTPVVVTPVGGLPEVVSPLCSGLVTGDTSAESIGSRLSELLAGRVFVPSSEECRAYACERFDWTAIARQVLDVYREARQARS